jgi:predicted protein tyrosine phosphatase
VSNDDASEERPRIVSRPLRDAERDIPNLESDDAVVSIGAPGTKAPRGFNPDHPRHLRLQFDDVVSDVPAFGDEQVRPPRRDHIQQLIDAADEMLDAGIVYVHCAAGISRAPAASFILRCVERGPGEEKEALEDVLEDTPNAAPNSKMVEIADQLMERDGAMVAALEENSGPSTDNPPRL